MRYFCRVLLGALRKSIKFFVGAVEVIFPIEENTSPPINCSRGNTLKGDTMTVVQLRELIAQYPSATVSEIARLVRQ
jgi:hypothetical protein